MSISHTPRSSFVDRFERLFTRARRASLGVTLGWTVLLTTVGFIWLAVADYLLELDRTGRLVGLGMVATGGLVLALLSVIYSLRKWTSSRTVARLEQKYPELGQSVRTSVEYGKRSEEDLAKEGIDGSLVQALTNDTEVRAAALPLESVVPSRSFMLVAAAAAVALALVVAANAMDWQWRTATSRALLTETPYTEVEVLPGSLTINEGDSVDLQINVLGRTDRQVTLWSRSLLDADEAWLETELSEADRSAEEPQKVSYLVPLVKLDEPLEYRVVAGPAESDVYRIDVRFPLEIKRFAAHITPPEYTGIEPSISNESNLNVIEGSQVTLEIELDRKPQQASMIIRDLGTQQRGEPAHEEQIPLSIDGHKLTASLQLSTDQSYSILARSDDDMALPANHFRIRVRHDQSPQVWFEEPRDSLEVHGLAEVMLRIRARDDFGLTRSGIVFEINNEREFTLLEKDYREVIAELAAAGEDVGNQTRDALQRLLPLEYFKLTQKDSVTFYAFAEDNLPGQTQRTETDLQFIDIRPFRRLYRLPDENMENMNDGPQGPQVRFLQEIINRQRFNLNRTIRLDKRVTAGEDPALSMVDRIANFEDDLASSTRQLAEYLRRFNFEDLDLLFQAETSMLSAVDTLGVGKYSISTDQQKDALRLLIEGRNSIEIQLRKATASQRNALGQFDQMQIQRLRMERDNENEETPERLVDRIRQLSARQQNAASAMQAMANNNGENGNSGAGTESEQEATGSAAAEENPEEPTEETEGGSSEESAEENPDETEAESAGSADEEMANDSATEPTEMTRQEVQEEQQDIALEAREIETTLNRNRDISSLAQERATAAADMADQAAGELMRGSTEEAAETANETATALRELALNVEGLLAEEATRKIAMSRDLAGGLARAQRDIAEEAEETEQASASGSPTEAEKSEEMSEEVAQAALAQRAKQLAETGMTMEDILASLAETNSRRESEAVRRVEEILADGQLSEAVQRMRVIGAMLEEDSDETPLEVAAIADQLDATARQLDVIYRATVTPRTEQLMQLEQKATELGQDLVELETNQEITAWHAEAMELLNEVDQAGAGETAPDELYEAMQGGRGQRKSALDWDWGVGTNSYHEAPPSYVKATQKLVEELQQHIQEVILTDMASQRDQGTPPQYRHLIERYREVLSADVEATE